MTDDMEQMAMFRANAVGTASARSGPIARASDPSTSHLAAAQITADGTREVQAAAVLSRLEDKPGSTSAELADAEWDRYVIARRLPELERLGLARRGEPRKCKTTGRSALTWWPLVRGVTNL